MGQQTELIKRQIESNRKYNLEQRLQQATEILRELVEQNKELPEGEVDCFFCKKNLYHMTHKPNCVWRRAKQFCKEEGKNETR